MGVLLNEFAHTVIGKATRLGDPRDLDFRVRRRNVRIESAAGSRHGIGGNNCIRRQIARTS